jgi:hypothetical protein
VTEFTDLAPCTWLVQDPAIVAVGWLERGAMYTTGPTDKAVMEALRALISAPNVGAPACAGNHACTLCQFEPPRFNGEFYVPRNGRIYVSPKGIIHYIAQHWYQPPDEFCEAVLKCPPVTGMVYRKAFLDNGGRKLVQAWQAPNPFAPPPISR